MTRRGAAVGEGTEPVWLDPAELLSGSQVAAVLHLEKQKALDWIADGTIPSVTMTGGAKRVPRWALIEWQRARLSGVSVQGAVSVSVAPNHLVPIRTERTF